MKHKGLIKTIDRLLAEREDNTHELVLRDGSVVRFTVQQLQKGCADSGRVRSFEAYAIETAISGSGLAERWLQLYKAVKFPVST